MPDPRQAAASRPWYHAIELAPGVVTDGWFDLRAHVGRYGLPEDLRGLRALDVGTWDGFWAFELERRGAEVTALDLDDEDALDWPPARRPPAAAMSTEPRGAGFALAAEVLGSRVRRVDRSLYAATPEELGGPFDLVLAGSILVHLRDQTLALERLHGLLRPGGLLISAEEHDRPTGLLPFPAGRYLALRERSVVFWLPNLRAWRAMHAAAGFASTDVVARFDMQAGRGDGRFSVRHAVLHSVAGPRAGRGDHEGTPVALPRGRAGDASGAGPAARAGAALPSPAP